MTRVTANGYFDAEDSEQVRFEKRKALNTQRTEDYKNGAYALAGGVRVLRRHLPEGAFDDGRGIIANAQFQKEDFLPRAGSEKTLIPRRCPMPALVLNKGIIAAEVHGHGLAAVGTGWKKLGQDFHIFLSLDHFTNRVCVFVRS